GTIVLDYIKILEQGYKWGNKGRHPFFYHKKGGAPLISKPSGYTKSYLKREK
ncbi:hypothetical protein THERMOS_155, partial [Bathymodiolus thermophilus thioautotrophic gill symbiont]